MVLKTSTQLVSCIVLHATFFFNLVGLGATDDQLFQNPKINGLGGFLATADINGDGHLDICAAIASGSGGVKVLVGNGDATFEPSVLFEVAGTPVDIQLADLNNDGHLDIATANTGDQDVSVLLGLGNGGFEPAQNFSSGQTGAASATCAIGDFDNDGIADIAVTNRDFDSVSVFFGNGDGSLSDVRVISIGTRPFQMEGVDINGDQIEDLLVGSLGFPGEIMVLQSNGDRSFEVRPPLSAGSLNTVTLVVCDFNSDGHADYWSGNTSFLGNGDGTFQEVGKFPAITQVSSSTCADFDNDGNIDLGFAGEAGSWFVLLGNGDGTFQAAAEYEWGGSRDIAAGDFDEDGVLDVVLSAESSSSLLIGTDGTFPSINGFATGMSPRDLEVIDLNLDGQLDVVTSDRQDSAVSVLSGLGNANFTLENSLSVGADPGATGIGDFNGDGHLDIVAANFQILPSSFGVPETISILLSNGDGNFSKQTEYFAGLRPRSVAVEDFDADGNLDVAVANLVSDSVSILLGDGDGTFQLAETLSANDGAFRIVAANYNGDQWLDIAVSNRNSHDVSVFLGLENGSFDVAVNYQVGDVPTGLVAVDIDSDGALDLVTANRDSSDISVLFGIGDGAFANEQRYDTGSGASSLDFGDFNQDGILDLVTCNRTDHDVSILFGLGNGLFGNRSSFVTGGLPEAIQVDDVNEDGLPDIVVCARSNDAVNVLLNQLQVIPGDLNDDGKVDLLDVAPFVEILINGLFSIRADVNQDGIVNLLDVTPFVELLTSQ